MDKLLKELETNYIFGLSFLGLIIYFELLQKIIMWDIQKEVKMFINGQKIS